MSGDCVKKYYLFKYVAAYGWQLMNHADFRGEGPQRSRGKRREDEVKRSWISC